MRLLPGRASCSCLSWVLLRSTSFHVPSTRRVKRAGCAAHKPRPPPALFVLCGWCVKLLGAGEWEQQACCMSGRLPRLNPLHPPWRPVHAAMPPTAPTAPAPPPPLTPPRPSLCLQRRVDISKLSGVGISHNWNGFMTAAQVGLGWEEGSEGARGRAHSPQCGCALCQAGASSLPPMPCLGAPSPCCCRVGRRPAPCRRPAWPPPPPPFPPQDYLANFTATFGYVPLQAHNFNWGHFSPPFCAITSLGCVYL